MNYLQDIIKVTEYQELKDKYPEGTLILTDKQKVIDECLKHRQPVAAFEHEGATKLVCQYILLDVEQVDDEEFENIYRRYMNIPLDIGQTERTYIREFSMPDLDRLFELYSKPGITDYMEPLFEYENEKQYESNYIEYIYKMYGFGIWLVFDKETDELIGRAGIEVRDTCDRENQAELGFCISPDRWKEGLAFEVCSFIIDISREEYGLTSLIARCDKENIASVGLLKKLGFSLVGYQDDGDCRFFREIV